jgi:hypothetical protein
MSGASLLHERICRSSLRFGTEDSLSGFIACRSSDALPLESITEIVGVYSRLDLMTPDAWTQFATRRILPVIPDSARDRLV